MNPISKILGYDVSDNRIYVKSPHGYRVRFHKIDSPPQNVILAMEFIIDQITWRKEEWGFLKNHKKAITDLAVASAREHNLQGNDLQIYINELKARKYGVDWNRFNSEVR